MYNYGEKRELMIEIAKLYYLDGMSQQEIASLKHMSRSNVSRLLNSCIENKIIEVRINDVFSKRSDLAGAIKRKYGLKDVLINTSHEDPYECQKIAAGLAAQYLETKLQDGMLLGISNGVICSEIADAFSDFIAKQVHTIQLIGGMDCLVRTWDSPWIIQKYAKKFFGKSYALYAPAMVRTKQLKSVLMQEPSIGVVFDKYKEVDIALLSINKTEKSMVKQQAGYLTKPDILQLSEVAAVGEICGCFFDVEGNFCNVGVKDRVMGIDRAALSNVPLKVAFACGIYYEKAVIGALKTGLIDVLIVDENLAIKLLRTENRRF